MTSVLIRDMWEIYRQKRGQYREEEAAWPQIGAMRLYKPRNAAATQNWRGKAQISPEPPEGVWPWPKTLISDFRPPQLWDQISFVLSYGVCGNLLHQPQETNTQGVTKLEEIPPKQLTFANHWPPPPPKFSFPSFLLIPGTESDMVSPMCPQGLPGGSFRNKSLPLGLTRWFRAYTHPVTSGTHKHPVARGGTRTEDRARVCSVPIHIQP